MKRPPLIPALSIFFLILLAALLLCSPSLPIAGLITTMALAFVAAATMAQRNRRLPAEILTLLGTLLLGVTILTLGRLHGLLPHTPDRLLWWAVGAIAAAWLTQSTLCGIGALILLSAWTFQEASLYHHPNYLLLPLWALTAALALRRASVILHLLCQVALAGWLMFAAHSYWDAQLLLSLLVSLLGATYVSIGLWLGPREPAGQTWMIAGLVLLLMGLILPSTSGFHEYLWRHYRPNPRNTWQLLTLTLLLTAVSLASFLRAKRGTQRDHWPIPAIALIHAGYVITILCLSPTSIRYTFPAQANSPTTLIALSLFCAAVWLTLRSLSIGNSLNLLAVCGYLMLFVLATADSEHPMPPPPGLCLLGLLALLLAVWFRTQRQHSLGAIEEASDV